MAKKNPEVFHMLDEELAEIDKEIAAETSGETGGWSAKFLDWCTSCQEAKKNLVKQEVAIAAADLPAESREPDGSGNAEWEAVQRALDAYVRTRGE